MARSMTISAVVLAGLTGVAAGQGNSLFLSASQAQQQSTTPPPQNTWPSASVPIVYGMSGQANPGTQNTSLIAVQLPPPRVFKPHDLVTIIIKEEKQYKHDANMESKKDYNVDAKLNQWFRIQDGWQQQKFPKGNPQIGGTIASDLKDTGTSGRTDALTERVTVEIIDTKPNGTLSLKGHKNIKTDEEEQSLTLTGTCRAEDVGPDNTILSTQVHDLNLSAQSKGAVKDATSRGWLQRLLDKGKPF